MKQGSSSSSSGGGGGGSGGGSNVAAGRVTWRRLHAMGPSRLLGQQLRLGLLASVSTTQ
jgi:hypothetical protein